MNRDGDTTDTVAYFTHVEQSAGSTPPHPETPNQNQPNNDVNPMNFVQGIVDGINSLSASNEPTGNLAQLVNNLSTTANNRSLDDAGRAVAATPILQAITNEADSLTVSPAGLADVSAIVTNAQALLDIL